MRIDSRLHVVVILTTAALMCGSVLLFNLFVDPFGMYRLLETDGSHAAKPAAYRRVKPAKAYDLRRIAPEAIVLGTSRSHVALRMTHDGWKVPLARRYNAAFDGRRRRKCMPTFSMLTPCIRFDKWCSVLTSGSSGMAPPGPGRTLIRPFFLSPKSPSTMRPFMPQTCHCLSASIPARPASPCCATEIRENRSGWP